MSSSPRDEFVRPSLSQQQSMDGSDAGHSPDSRRARAVNWLDEGFGGGTRPTSPQTPRRQQLAPAHGHTHGYGATATPRSTARSTVP